MKYEEVGKKVEFLCVIEMYSRHAQGKEKRIKIYHCEKSSLLKGRQQEKKRGTTRVSQQ